MRCILFHSAVESFNYFTDCLCGELHKRGHETFLLPLERYGNPDSYPSLVNDIYPFVSGGVDAVICYDGNGCSNDFLRSLWDMTGAAVVNILMDPPFRFPDIHIHPPKRYIEFCCDREHVNYVRKYYGDSVKDVYFLPHFGTPVSSENVPSEIIPWNRRRYDILFSGTYYRPDGCLAELDRETEPASPLNSLLKEAAESLALHPSLSLPEELERLAQTRGWTLSKRGLAALASSAVPVDWYVRMLYRERVARTLIESGQSVALLGRGWENLPDAGRKNVTLIGGRVPFAESLRVMADARINLNVMPWFRDGTHDRIFNSLLRDTMPLTDSSRFLKEFFHDGEEIRYYDLEHLNELPAIAEDILGSPEKVIRQIRRGRRIVEQSFTWKQCADILEERIAAGPGGNLSD